MLRVAMPPRRVALLISAVAFYSPAYHRLCLPCPCAVLPRRGSSSLLFAPLHRCFSSPCSVLPFHLAALRFWSLPFHSRAPPRLAELRLCLASALRSSASPLPRLALPRPAFALPRLAELCLCSAHHGCSMQFQCFAKHCRAMPSPNIAAPCPAFALRRLAKQG